MDYKTISKNTIVGPRFMTLVDATKPAMDEVKIKLHNVTLSLKKLFMIFILCFAQIINVWVILLRIAV